ncbi:MAG: SDR family oxidoreductase [Alphaproteobacteria bacterium]|nr:SDR family oxidoreductase [Alphaproteobacteria bacterium]
MIDFKERVLFLTGATGGIGAAIARVFLRLNARLFLTDTDQGKLDALKRELGGPAERIAAARVDVTVVNQVNAALVTCQRQFGGIDYLVPGAGIFQIQPVTTMSDADWRRMMSVNLDGVFHTCRAAIPLMRDNGAIVTIASVAGHRGGVNLAHYSATKGAVLTFTRVLAAELAPRLRANAVSPGLIDTAMITDLMQLRGEALLKGTAMKRLGRPDEVADAIAFLCSDMASYITGETLHVNGGLYIAS